MNASLEDQFERYCRQGDVAALADVFDRTAAEILRVALHLVRDPADAEELLQETFVTAIRRGDTFDPSRPIVPWLLGILANLARNTWRKKGRRPDPSRLDLPVEWPESGPTEGRELHEAVAKAVDGIAEPYRATLVLHLQHGLSPVQIAHALNLPPATVRSHLHRGLQRLRTKLPRSVAPRALAALPLTLTGGLSAVRESVLAEGAALAVVAPSTAALVLGGILVTKNALGAAVALLCLLLLAGGAYLVFDASSGEEEAANGLVVEQADSPGAVPHSRSEGPALTAAGSAPPPSSGHTAAESSSRGTGSKTPTRVPLDAPIPEGKGSVAGTLHFEDGSPVVGVKVALWGESPVEDVTDAEGAFHLHGDWVAGRQLYVKGERRFDAVILKHVAMKADQLVHVAFAIARGHEWRGTIHSDRDEAPIGGTLVTLRRPGSTTEDAVQAGYASHRTDEQGRFHFRFLPAAVYTVELGEPGYESWFGQIEIGADTPDTAYRLKASRPFLITFEGLPAEAEGARVSWMFSRIETSDAHYSSDGKGTLEPEGRLHLDAPPPGEYRLLLFRSKFTDRVEQEVLVGEEQLEPLVIPRVLAARVEGVLRSHAGKPIADTQLQIGNSIGLRTDAEGRFVIKRSPAGTQTVWVMFPTGWVALPQVEVGSTGTLKLELGMPGGAALKGRVLKKHGVHGNGSLWMLGEKRRHVAIANPDAEGRFELPHLVAGRYEFLWSEAGAAPLRSEVDLVAGSTFDLGELVAAPLPRVPVEVGVPRGEALPLRLQMKIVFAAGGRNRSVAHMGSLRLDAEGRGEVTTFQPGSYDLIFSAPPYADVEVHITVRDGENEVVVIALQRP